MGFREGRHAEPDRTRGPGWLRLYPPGQTYWEDDTHAARPIQSLSVSFFVERGCAFWQKFAGTGRVVQLHDPDGRATRRMHTLVEQASTYWTDPELRGQRTLQNLLADLLGAVPMAGCDYAIGSAPPGYAEKKARVARPCAV